MDRIFSRAFAWLSGRKAATGSAAMAVCLSCMVAGCTDVGSNVSDIGSGLSDLGANLTAKRIDLVAEHKVVAQCRSGPGLSVSLPSVFGKRDELEVFGTVTREPGNDSKIMGFLDVQIRATTGELIDQSLIHWVPETIPTDRTRSAMYSAKILHIPPVGSIVRVVYVEKVGDLEEPIGPPENGGTGGGARGGGGGRSAFGSGLGKK